MLIKKAMALYIFFFSGLVSGSPISLSIPIETNLVIPLESPNISISFDRDVYQTNYQAKEQTFYPLISGVTVRSQTASSSSQYEFELLLSRHVCGENELDVAITIDDLDIDVGDKLPPAAFQNFTVDGAWSYHQMKTTFPKIVQTSKQISCAGNLVLGVSVSI